MTESSEMQMPPVGSAEFFRAIVDTCADPIVVIDEDFVLQYASGSITNLLGWGADEWIGRSVAELLHPESILIAAQGIADLKAAHFNDGWIGAPIRLLLKNIDGDWIPVDAMSRDSNRTGVDGFVVVIQPAGGAQALSEVVDALLDGGGGDRIFELLTPFVEHNIYRSCATLYLGWNGDCFEERIGSECFVDLCSSEGADRSAVDLALAADGVVDVYAELSDTARREAESAGMFGCWCRSVNIDPSGEAHGLLLVWTTEAGPPGAIYSRIVERAASLAGLVLRWDESQRSLSWRATHDVLTRLMNRNEFQCRLDESAGRRRAVLYCDLDGFKPVNEDLGHRVGDELLAAVAGRIHTVCADHLVARLGGDEFAVLLEPVVDLAEAVRYGEAIRDAVGLPFAVLGNTLGIGISVGVAFDEAGVVDPDELVDRADQLLRDAKEAGKNRVHSLRVVPGS